MSDPVVDTCAECQNSYDTINPLNGQAARYCSYFSCKDPINGYDQNCVFNRSPEGPCLPGGIYWNHGYPGYPA